MISDLSRKLSAETTTRTSLFDAPSSFTGFIRRQQSWVEEFSINSSWQRWNAHQGIVDWFFVIENKIIDNDIVIWFKREACQSAILLLLILLSFFITNKPLTLISYHVCEWQMSLNSITVRGSIKKINEDIQLL